MKSLVIAGIALVLSAATLPAQRQASGSAGVPPGHRPPPGLCRIWIDGVPPGRQPAPMHCDDARRRRPANARVIYGAATRDDGRWDRDDRDDRARGRKNDRWDDRDDDRDHRAKGKKDDRWKRKEGKHRKTSDVCHDRNRDGWCDWATGSRTRHERRRTDTCLDRNRDGRCDDAVRRAPSADAAAAIAVIFGKR